ncbi:hypothetical protein [Streptomyces sp. NPDC050982]
MGRQNLADALDDEMRKRLLPPTAVRALGLWPAGSGAALRREGLPAR